jgi:hypothetical protein
VGANLCYALEGVLEVDDGEWGQTAIKIIQVIVAERDYGRMNDDGGR